MNIIEKYKKEKDNFKVLYDKSLKNMSNDEIDYHIIVIGDFIKNDYNIVGFNQLLFILNDYKIKLSRKIKL